MAEFKKKVLVLSTGKQIKLYGNSIAIGRSLEIGEGYAPNVFSSSGDGISNPHQLTADELMELADYCMQCWMDLKTEVRYGERKGICGGKPMNKRRNDNGRPSSKRIHTKDRGVCKNIV